MKMLYIFILALFCCSAVEAESLQNRLDRAPDIVLATVLRSESVTAGPESIEHITTVNRVKAKIRIDTIYKGRATKKNSIITVTADQPLAAGESYLLALGNNFPANPKIFVDVAIKMTWRVLAEKEEPVFVIDDSAEFSLPNTIKIYQHRYFMTPRSLDQPRSKYEDQNVVVLNSYVRVDDVVNLIR